MLKRFLKIARYAILIMVFLSIIPIVFLAYKLKHDYPLREYMKTNYFSSIPDDVNQLLGAAEHDTLKTLIHEIELMVPQESIDSLGRQIANRIQHISLGKDFILGTSHWTYVAAKLRFQSDTVDVKIRIRGDFPTNYNRTLSESTFRIDIKGGDFINGKKKISLIRPELENNLYGFLYYKCFESEGFIANDIDFVKLIFNGKPSGIRFLQEGFSPELIASSKRIAGPIIRFKNDCVDNIGRYNPDRFPEMVAYKEKKTLKDEALSKQYARALNKYNALVGKQISVAQCFDIDTYAKFMALSDVFLSHHAYKCQNVKAYFNPINDKFEPIAWDPSSYVRYHINLPVFPGHNEWFGAYYNQPNVYPIHFVLSQSSVFQMKYMSYLQMYIQDGKIDTMLNQFSSEVAYMNPILFKQNFQKRFDNSLYKTNIQEIRDELLKSNHIQAVGLIREKKLSIQSTHAFPVIIDSISYMDQFLKIDTILLPKSNMDLALPFNTIAPSSTKINIYSTVLGTPNSSLYKAKIFYALDDQHKVLFIEKFKPEFFDIDSIAMTLSLKRKQIVFSESVFIPSGFEWILEKGTNITLENKSSIVSESPIRAKGLINEGINVKSNGGGGLLIKNTGEKTSHLAHVNFESLHNLIDDNWHTTAGVTFYKSKVEIEACSFNNSQAEAALNIINSIFLIHNSLIINSTSYGLDVNYGTGEVNDLTVQHTGKNAINILGSTVKLNALNLKDIGRQPIQIDEASILSTNGIRTD